MEWLYSHWKTQRPDGGHAENAGRGTGQTRELPKYEK